MQSPIWLFFVLRLGLTSGYHFLEDEEEPFQPYFPAEYKMSGEEIYVISQIIIPFKAWYSTEYNRSRIDYFGGMVKRYYYAKTDDYKGRAYEIHPETNEEVTNEMVCYETKHHRDQKNFLPNLEHFQYKGVEEIHGQNTEKWVKTTNYTGVSGAKVEETLWLLSFDKESQAVPVRYEVKIYSNLLHILKRHEVVNYFTFETSVESEDLQVEDEFECKKVKEGDLETLAFVEPHDDELVAAVFTQYKEKHNRKYDTEDEHEMRRDILRKNLEKILATNHQKLGYTLALNKFADRTEEELLHLTALEPSDHDDNGTIPFPYERHEVDKLADECPIEYDMRLEGLISPVQDQFQCGACWAFGATATIEGALARSNGGPTLRLSEQALIDCAWGYSTNGCNGGSLSKAFRFVIKHGVPTDEDYGPYMAMDGYCRLDEMPSVQTIKGFTKVTPMDENALKMATYNHGPVAVSIYTTEDLHLYSGGIFYDVNCDKKKHDGKHAVTVVGYGEKHGQRYWIVKNSWGHDWGSGGYIMMSTKNNNCGVERRPYYVVI